MVDVGASFPHRVTLHPTCHSLRLLEIGDRPRRLLEAVRGIDLVELEGERECCGFGGTFAIKNADTSMAMLSDKVRHVLDTRAEVCTSRRHVVPDAHRRRAVAGPHRRADDAPGGDPGGAGMSFQSAARVTLADAQLRRNIGKATGLIRAKRERAVAELPDWEAAARRRRGDQGARDGDAARAAGAAGGGGRRGRRRGALGARRRRGQRDRGCGRARARHRRGHQGQVAGHGRDRDERGVGGRGHPRAGDRPGRADRAARAGRQAVAHPRAGDPSQPGGDPRAVRAHDRPGAVAGQRGDGDRRGRARCTCARSS